LRILADIPAATVRKQDFVDATGAGDSYSAYVALAMAMGMTPREAAKGGAVCGALTVERRGGGSIVGAEGGEPLKIFRNRMRIFKRELAEHQTRVETAEEALRFGDGALYTVPNRWKLALSTLALACFDLKLESERGTETEKTFRLQEYREAKSFNRRVNPWARTLGALLPARVDLWALQKKGIIRAFERKSTVSMLGELEKTDRFVVTPKGKRILRRVFAQMMDEVGPRTLRMVPAVPLAERRRVAVDMLTHGLSKAELKALVDIYNYPEKLEDMRLAAARGYSEEDKGLYNFYRAAFAKVRDVLDEMGVPTTADTHGRPDITRIGGIATLSKALAATTVQAVQPQEISVESAAEETVAEGAVRWLMSDLRGGRRNQLIQGLNALADGNHMQTLYTALSAILAAPQAKAFFESADIYAGLHEKVVKRLAARTGEMIMEKGGLPYLLLVPFEFHKGSEFEDDKDDLGLNSRYDVERVGGKTLKEYVNAILNDKAKGREDKAVALIPGRLVTMTDGTNLELKRLMDAKVRFIVADLDRYGRAMGKQSRQAFRANSYSIMHLVRFVNSDMKGTLPYATLFHYLKRHFKLPEGMAVDDYLKALAGKTMEDVLTILKGWLVPIEKEDADKEHTNLSRPLIFA
jgi:hypothetical protein